MIDDVVDVVSLYINVGTAAARKVEKFQLNGRNKAYTRENCTVSLPLLTKPFREMTNQGIEECFLMEVLPTRGESRNRCRIAFDFHRPSTHNEQ